MDKALLKRIADLRARLAGAESAEIKAARDFRVAEAEVVMRRRKEDGDSAVTARLAEKAASLGVTRDALIGERATLSDQLAEILEGLALTSPQELAANIAPDVPVALFPLKLETRFFREGRRHHLRVRIFPDQIAISAFQEALTEAEVEAGKAFWRDMSEAFKSDAVRAGQEAAAQVLAKRTEGNRTLWIALQTRPKNWPAREGQTPPPPEDLEFPQIRNTPTPNAASARILPDRFVIELYRERKLVHSATTQPVRGTLLMGPDSEGVIARIDRDKASGAIDVTDNLKWLFDYDEAVKAGMAVTIPISSADRAEGFDQVLALGVRFSEGGEGGAAMLERHLRDLRFSTGFDVLPNGTATNNTEEVGSGFDSSQPDGVDEVLKLARNVPSATPKNHRRKRDGQRLAEALGLPEDALASLAHADQNDIGEALSMNRALWSATLGGYMRDFLSPLRGGTVSREVDAQLARRITRFGTDFLTGRGLLPSIRVGKQPYGVLITSHYPTFDPDDRPLGVRTNRFPREIKPLMDTFSQLFNGFRGHLKAIGQDEDPDEILTNILGLHASSVTYQSRKAVSDGVSWNNLLMLGYEPKDAEALFEFVQSIRGLLTQRIGLNGSREISELLFLRDADDLTGPVVDDDPDTPLSETAPIRAFDGTNNYVDWLRTSTPEILRSQKFSDENGETVTRPRALLYKYLRHALLAEIAEQSAKFVAAVPQSKVNHEEGRSAVTAADSELTELKLPDEAAMVITPKSIGLSVEATNVGEFLVGETAKRPDLVLDIARNFTLPIAGVRAALGDLADLPTARLERLFAEHMDTLSYRLDAWQSAMFASRLHMMRESRKESTGVMIGAYGYLEDLQARPAPRAVPARQIPQDLVPDGAGPVVSRPDNGGFVHAPSQAHAVTAAVLRNGYLTHADRDENSRFAINLDSARVRKALYLVEGLRHNQSMSALLGYRLERGLHENHPGLQLDAFIYSLRQRFPFTSRRLVDVDTSASAEVVEARNVIDGYDLVEHARENAYPWGARDMPASGSAEARAIQAEVDAIEDLYDAYGDLMMAESVHQAVNGNTERADGALGALSQGDVPPMPEVVETPRSGTVINQTVMIRFPKAAHWTKTARSSLNARMNGWLVRQLPAPEEISLGFNLNGTQDHMSLRESGLDALDVVLMANEQLGDGSSQLERWLVDVYRQNHALPDDVFVRFRDGPSAPADAAHVLEVDTGLAPDGNSLDDVLACLLAHQRLVTKARNANALDARLPTETGAALPDNPKGLRLSSGAPRARAGVVAAFEAFGDTLAVVTAFATKDAHIAAYDALILDPGGFEPSDWGDVDALRSALRALWLMGHSQAAPRHPTGLDSATARDLFEQAVLVDQAVTPYLARAETALEPIPDPPGAEGSVGPQAHDKRIRALDTAAKALFTDSFRLSHEFTYEAEQRAELQLALASPVETDPLKIETWLQGLVRLRPALYSLSIIQDWSTWLGGAPAAITPVQLPRIAGEPWVGGGWKPDDAIDERLALTMVGDPGAPDGAQAGLIIDSFAERVPTKSEITGLSFHYDRPNAEAPQAVLLAVPPSLEKGWSWDALRDTVLDTFERAKLRAVEPDQLTGTDYFQVLPANLVPFSQGFSVSTFLASNSIAAFEVENE